MTEALDSEAIARALELVRGGEGVSLGGVGGKCWRSLECRSGVFWILEFDEGADFDRAITEEQALETLASAPEAVQTLLARQT